MEKEPSFRVSQSRLKAKGNCQQGADVTAINRDIQFDVYSSIQKFKYVRSKK
jgi:hypothetical protein